MPPSGFGRLLRFLERNSPIEFAVMIIVFETLIGLFMTFLVLARLMNLLPFPSDDKEGKP